MKRIFISLFFFAFMWTAAGADASPELLAMLGSALATSISDVPFDGPCATTQVGMIAGEFILNPGNGEKAVSDL